MKQLIVLLGILLVAITGCSHTTQNSPMLQDQAELIRSNFENLKLGMSVEGVKTLLGPPTIYRTKTCDCNECAPLGAASQKIEKLWYVYKSVKDPTIFIYLAFRHDRLFDGRAQTPSGVIVIK